MSNKQDRAVELLTPIQYIIEEQGQYDNKPNQEALKYWGRKIKEAIALLNDEEEVRMVSDIRYKPSLGTAGNCPECKQYVNALGGCNYCNNCGQRLVWPDNSPQIEQGEGK
jgi:hypothetical protein